MKFNNSLISKLFLLTTTLIMLPSLFEISVIKADTIRMMQYNLMYYTTSVPSDCDASGDYLNNKDSALKAIFHYVQPDVLCVNEIGSQSSYVTRILNNALNTDGINYFANCPLTNFSGGSIANMLFYDSRKLAFDSYFYITTSYRDINAYRLYYKSEELAMGDTVFVTFLIAHLKAGSSSSDASARYTQVDKLMSKLTQIGRADNYILSGDFNLYGADEASYQHLIHYPNSLFQFYDPIDQEGAWNNNYNYRYIHTQSTHTYSEEGECFASGGMDDRFDFILVSPYIYYGSYGLQAIPNSYKALGQDGNRFNGTIISPSNNSIPVEISNALFNLSDHLPILMDMSVDATLGIENNVRNYSFNVVNPIQNNLSIYVNLIQNEMFTFEIYSVEGKLLESFQKMLSAGNNHVEHAFRFPSSFYLLKITDSHHQSITKKLIK